MPAAVWLLMKDEEPETVPNADQLRSAIDRGAAGDKVAFPDPAAAPLGTDAEAGGVAPSARELHQAFKAEGAAAPQQARGHQGRAFPLVLGVIALIAISSVLTLLIFAR